MDNVNSFFTIHGEFSFILHYSWIVLHLSMNSELLQLVNFSIHVQLDELV